MAFQYFRPPGLAQEKTSFVLCGPTLSPSTGLAIWPVAVLTPTGSGVRGWVRQGQPLLTTGETALLSGGLPGGLPRKLQETCPQRAGRAEALQINLSASWEQGSGAQPAAQIPRPPFGR